MLCFTYYQDDFILPSKYNILKGLGENIFLISILNAELPNLIYFWTTSIFKLVRRESRFGGINVFIVLIYLLDGVV